VSCTPARKALTLVLTVAIALGGAAAVARADGDPASDVLVNQRTFVPSDAHAGRGQAARLDALLARAQRAGYPVRVAIIATGYDLGSVTVLWHRPRVYARFLGIELSLIQRRPLLVVMPNGFGFDWPGHSAAPADRALARIHIRASRGGLLAAAQAGVRAIAAADRVRLSGRAKATPLTARQRASMLSNEHTAVIVVIAAPAAMLAAALLALVAVRLTRALRPARPAPAGVLVAPAPVFATAAAARPTATPPRSVDAPPPAAPPPVTPAPVTPAPAAARRRRLRAPVGRAAVGVGALCGVAVAVPFILLTRPDHGSPSSAGSTTAAAVRAAEGAGTPFVWAQGARPAPNFHLFTQSGHPISMRAFRGRPVIITFVDPLCRNLCPLAAHVLNQVARQMPVRTRPAIIAVSVDVYADRRADLRLDERRWELVPQWYWAVGRPGRLAAVWRRYRISVSVATKRIAGTTVHFITHDEAAYVIDRRGDERALYFWPYRPQTVEQELMRLSRA
jgi:cytochrome oxidase Cu insertion factor (SCO1/SenC/PrrC family)